jgi:cell division protein DivIC
MGSARFLDPSSIPLKRQSGGNIWATLVHVTQAVTVIVLLSGLMLFFLPVIQKSNHLKAEKMTLQNKIGDAQDQQQQLQLETEHMKNDPAYVEHIARDRLNMGRPGEYVFKFDSYQTATPDPKSVKPTPEGASASGN